MSSSKPDSVSPTSDDLQKNSPIHSVSKVGSLNLLNVPRRWQRSFGLDMLRGFFTLYVLILSHLVPWVSYSQGNEASLVALSPITLLNELFQKHAELNPAVLQFIVLSGFCIHRNGVRSSEDLPPFAIRRTFRIIPVFWLVSILSVWIFLQSVRVDAQAAHTLAGTQDISIKCLLAKMTTIAALIPSSPPLLLPRQRPSADRYGGSRPLRLLWIELQIRRRLARSKRLYRERPGRTRCGSIEPQISKLL